MISKHDVLLDKNDIWSKLAAKLPAGAVSWRQQGKPIQRDGKWLAPFVAYTDAQVVRERLDLVVAGEWDLTLFELPRFVNGDGEDEVAFKARLQVLGVIREDVGTGTDYKTAATDAFKRAAVRFGIGHELYSEYEIVYVQVDGDSKYAKPKEDPNAVWARKHARATEAEVRAAGPITTTIPAQPPTALQVAEYDALAKNGAGTAAAPSPATEEAACPKCGGRTWDNRATKTNPKAPDFKCRDRTCDGVIWPAKAGRNADGSNRAKKSEPAREPVPDTIGALPFDDAPARPRTGMDAELMGG